MADQGLGPAYRRFRASQISMEKWSFPHNRACYDDDAQRPRTSGMPCCPHASWKNLEKFAATREERGKALCCPKLSSTFSSIQHHSFMKRANTLILLYFTYIILASSGGKSEEVGESLERWISHETTTINVPCSKKRWKPAGFRLSCIEIFSSFPHRQWFTLIVVLWDDPSLLFMMQV